MGTLRPELRTLRIILNPHGGHGRAKRVLEDIVLPTLRLAGVGVQVTPTEYAGHTIEMGAEFDPDDTEGILFISGDGAVQEFLQGLVSRPDWMQVATRLVLGHIGCGSANALARGLHTMHPLAAVHAAIKCRVRPLDAALLSSGDGQHRLSVCGIGWGVPGDIAAASEEWRSCGGAYRYTWLKCLKGVLDRKRHNARVSYTLQGLRPVWATSKRGGGGPKDPAPRLKYELSGRAHLHAFSLNPNPQWTRLPGMPTHEAIFPPERYGLLYRGHPLPLPPPATLTPLAELPLSTQRRLGTVKGTRARDTALAVAKYRAARLAARQVAGGADVEGGGGASPRHPPRLATLALGTAISSAVSEFTAATGRVTRDEATFRSDTLRNMGAFTEAGLLKVLLPTDGEETGGGSRSSAKTAQSAAVAGLQRTGTLMGAGVPGAEPVPLQPTELMRQISVDTRDGRVYFSMGTRDGLGTGLDRAVTPPVSPIAELPPAEERSTPGAPGAGGSQGAASSEGGGSGDTQAGDEPGELPTPLAGDLAAAYYFMFTNADSKLHKRLQSRAADALRRRFEPTEIHVDGEEPVVTRTRSLDATAPGQTPARVLSGEDWRGGAWLWREPEEDFDSEEEWVGAQGGVPSGPGMLRSASTPLSGAALGSAYQPTPGVVVAPTENLEGAVGVAEASGGGVGEAAPHKGSVGRCITRHRDGTVTPPGALEHTPRGQSPPPPGSDSPAGIAIPRAHVISSSLTLVKAPSQEEVGAATATGGGVAGAFVHPAQVPVALPPPVPQDGKDAEDAGEGQSVVSFATPSASVTMSPAAGTGVPSPTGIPSLSPSLRPSTVMGVPGAAKVARHARAVPWRHETGAYIAVGAVNIAQDAFASHPSDGFFDLMLAREGESMMQVCGLLGRYIVGREYDSPMMDYYKASAVVITPMTRAPRGACGGWLSWLARGCGLATCAGTACEDTSTGERFVESHEREVLNVDGEVLTATGPFTIQHLPALITAYGEPYRSDTHTVNPLDRPPPPAIPL